MKILQELNQIADELNKIKESRPEPRKKHYEVVKKDNSYDVYNNHIGVTMASGLTLEQAINVLNILNFVSR